MTIRRLSGGNGPQTLYMGYCQWGSVNMHCIGFAGMSHNPKEHPELKYTCSN